MIANTKPKLIVLLLVVFYTGQWAISENKETPKKDEQVKAEEIRQIYDNNQLSSKEKLKQYIVLIQREFKNPAPSNTPYRSGEANFPVPAELGCGRDLATIVSIIKADCKITDVREAYSEIKDNTVKKILSLVLRDEKDIISTDDLVKLLEDKGIPIWFSEMLIEAIAKRGGAVRAIPTVINLAKLDFWYVNYYNNGEEVEALQLRIFPLRSAAKKFFDALGIKCDLNDKEETVPGWKGKLSRLEIVIDEESLYKKITEWISDEGSPKSNDALYVAETLHTEKSKTVLQTIADSKQLKKETQEKIIDILKRWSDNNTQNEQNQEKSKPEEGANPPKPDPSKNPYKPEKDKSDKK